ncbi:hypothetical protein A9Q84_07210 [Halobacteriovorax marinus]|uniref:Homeodomain phBC6A51-type domain-containing protein n=1 Tax=Halobacteriovorax marinus TaxID=97084 RepID=A0A1Y5FBY4_9BACT|nr:hypothetical protein A9Q84_07210 [Halobacteriovorax marinus]
MNNLGRPKIESSILKKIACKLAKVGYQNDDIAYFIGVGVSTLYRWLKYDRVFWQSIQDSKVEYDSDLEGRVLTNLIRGGYVSDIYENGEYSHSLKGPSKAVNISELNKYLSNRKTKK